jgi:hypothetical protein
MYVCGALLCWFCCHGNWGVSRAGSARTCYGCNPMLSHNLCGIRCKLLCSCCFVSVICPSSAVSWASPYCEGAAFAQLAAMCDGIECRAFCVFRFCCQQCNMFCLVCLSKRLAFSWGWRWAKQGQHVPRVPEKSLKSLNCWKHHLFCDGFCFAIVRGHTLSM